MARAHRWAQLKRMSHAELIREHDQHAESASDYLLTIRDELRHRQSSRQTRAMLIMTAVVVMATIANVTMWALR